MRKLYNMTNNKFRHYIANALLVCAVLVYGTATTSSCKCQPLSPDIIEAPSCCCEDADHQTTQKCSEDSDEQSSNSCCKSIGCKIIGDKQTVFNNFRENFVTIAYSTASDIDLTFEIKSNRLVINSVYTDMDLSRLCVFIC